MKTKYFNLIKDIKDKDLIISLYFTQMLLLTIAFILGIFLFDSFLLFWIYSQLLIPIYLLSAEWAV